jgi:hypothetical protein
MIDRAFNVGDMVFCSETGIVGEVVKFYIPTACEEQTMVRTLDDKKYHAPTRMWTPFMDDELVNDIKNFDKTAYIRSASAECTAPLAMPYLRETMEIHVDGTTLTVYKDDIQRELYKELYKGIFLPGT